AWLAFGLDACALGPTVGRLYVSPCLAIDAGILQGRGRIELPETKQRPWISLGPELVAEFDLSRRWFVGAEGGLMIALRHDTFICESPGGGRTVAHAVPILGGFGGLGVGYRMGDQLAQSRP